MDTAISYRKKKRTMRIQIAFQRQRLWLRSKQLMVEEIEQRIAIKSQKLKNKMFHGKRKKRLKTLMNH
jgi:hypothetical protein